MIGVISRKHENRIVEEFFQLFKTPWEYYSPQKSYDIVLSTEDVLPLSAKVLIIYNSQNCTLDSMHGIVTRQQDNKAPLVYKSLEFPIYGKLMTFMSSHRPLLHARNGSSVAGLRINMDKQQIVRIGYDLFEEVSFLLSRGQPREHALVPTLEFHIHMLRECILEAGMPLAEIPPLPAGHKFFACLTHDVDFVGIRRHKFDHTMLGFVYRASIGSILAMVRRRLTLRKVFRNWVAVFSLPGVYLGLLKDFWIEFEKYFEIERNLGSTFFFIPCKDNPGVRNSIHAPKRRAARYDIGDIPNLAKEVSRQQGEIGLHGIDAWHDALKARQEMNKVREVVPGAEMGVRMHWLYFDEQSPQVLEKAGFIYDSTFGYNDAVGHRAGTAQVFQPAGARTLLELPLHIMDTALFTGKRMNLSDSQAAVLCDKLLEDARQFGGSLTINWHHRSLAPDRFWGEFYQKLLQSLKARGACFMTAMRIVQWFQKRREIQFEEAHFTKSGVKVSFKRADLDCDPPLVLRIHLPSQHVPAKEDSSKFSRNCLEVTLGSATDLQISFAGFLTETANLSPGELG